jgi:hypothetical protein
MKHTSKAKHLKMKSLEMKKNSCAFKNIVFIDWTRFRLEQ